MFIPLHDANSLKHIHLQYVTLVIIAINVIFWIATGTPAISNAEVKQASFVAYGFIPSVANGYEILPADLDRIPATFTYLTYAFFHGDFMHLAGNMLFIWVFGDNVEDAMGHLKFVFFYVACATAAAFAHSMVDPQSSVPLIGASGAAAGIVGAYLLLHPKIRVWVLALGRFPLRIPAVIVLGLWIAFQIFQFLTDVDGQVSWAAHVGGLAAGGLLILVMRRPGVQLFDRDDVVAIPPTITPGAESENEMRPAGAEHAGRPAARASVPNAGSSAGPRPGVRWGRQDKA